LLDKATNSLKDIKIDAAFVCMGHSASTNFIFEKGIIGDNKLVVVNQETKSTSVPGIFAAGDVIREEGRQVITAANDGAVAAMNCINYVKNIKKI
jgi:thioredoxin reductase (NADPH)